MCAAFRSGPRASPRGAHGTKEFAVIDGRLIGHGLKGLARSLLNSDGDKWIVRNETGREAGRGRSADLYAEEDFLGDVYGGWSPMEVCFLR